MSDRTFGFRTTPQKAFSIRGIAARIRAELAPQLGAHEPIPGLELFEQLGRWNVGVRGVDKPLDMDVGILPQGVEALTYYNPKRNEVSVVLSERTYKDLEKGIPRSLFTFGHELGHAVLHSDLLVDMGTMPHLGLQRSRSSHQVYEDTEWQANTFSSYLLMPNEGLAQLDAKGQLDENAVAK